MNRLVIIGNGFDLAHGLPTTYKDFMDDFWCDLKENFNHEHFSKVIAFDKDYIDFFEYGKILSFKDFKRNLSEYSTKYGHRLGNAKFNCYAGTNLSDRKTIFKFKNNFFYILCERSIENWVEIENLYYDILKNISKGNYNKHNYIWGISKLNEEFEQVRNLLEKYLVEKVVEKYSLDFIRDSNSDMLKIYEVLKPISLFSNEDNVLKQFINADDVREIEEQLEKEEKEELVNHLYFLNFNYTPIASIYCETLNKGDRIESTINLIHGSLGNDLENKINFGFGDEMDEDYKAIENLNDNEYLKNFKSFQYLQNSNYNDLLRYIDSEKFQVLIMGHSCGLSDRTMLNTIFEHKNCRSIKVFYYEEKDYDGKIIKDNYTEIIQNISRHFNDKKLMREKIVNKTLCDPLPQIQLAIK